MMPLANNSLPEYSVTCRAEQEQSHSALRLRHILVPKYRIGHLIPTQHGLAQKGRWRQNVGSKTVITRRNPLPM